MERRTALRRPPCDANPSGWATWPVSRQPLSTFACRMGGFVPEMGSPMGVIVVPENT